jgi:16S rRNA (guanine527-N7)-methyltransferase
VNAAGVSARAFAPLDKVLAVAERHLSQDGTALFMKGQAYQSEMTVANQNWRYDCDVVPSKTDANSVILKVKKVRHA